MKRKILVALVVLFSLTVFIPILSFAQDEPMSPKDLIAEAKGSLIILTWTPPIDTSIIGFNLYRKEDISNAKLNKINKNILSDPTYSDKGVKKGKSYSYICKTINTDGIESEPSNIAGAPKMKMDTSAIVTHMGRKVRIAVPGDVIRYNVDFANQGYGIAKNVIIVYAIPKGTTFISGTAKCHKYKSKIEFFSIKNDKWVSEVDNEEDISKVRFTVLEDVHPVVKGNNGTAYLKVMVNY